MTDDPILGNRGNKPVTHEKWNIVRNNSLHNSTLTSGSDVFVSTGSHAFWHIWGLGSGELVSHRHISKYYSKDEQTLVRETMDAFYNVNEVDSLLNGVESPELLTGIQDLYRPLRDAVVMNGASNQRIRSRLSSAKRAGKAAAVLSGGYLYWSFGIAPLIGDLRKISKNLDPYRKRLEQVKRKAGQKISVHRSVTGSFGNIVADGNGNLPSGYGTGSNQSKSWTAELIPLVLPTMTCSIQGIREFKYSSSAFQTLDYLASRFGSVGPASFLWERIPFSFVVDWFVDLSGVMNSIDNALTGNTKRILGATISQKWKCMLNCTKVQYSPTLTDSNDGAQIALVELSSYLRKPTQPNISVGLSGRFGKKQGGITAALIGQMAANLVSKR